MDAAYRQLIERLSATPGRLAELAVTATDADLDRAEPGEWSARTVMAHLRDDESLVTRQRLERMLAEEGPIFPNFDEQAWERGRSHARDEVRTLLADFALQRQASVNLLQSLTSAQWERAGRHEVDGDYTVRTWVEHWAEHDDTHLAQIRRALSPKL